MRLVIINVEMYKFSKVGANARKTQLFQKNFRNFLNSSVVVPDPRGPSPVLLAAGGKPSTWLPPGRPRESREKNTLNHLQILLK